MKSFTVTEQTILVTILFIFLISGSVVIYNLNQNFLIEIPETGGTITEAVIGSPRLINPLLAVSETDKAMVNLIYSGLLRSTSEGLVPDLAESFTISEDMLEYHFYLKEDAVFHDGVPVTADDIIFTINAAQNPDLKSPKRANWEGINVEKISDREVKFMLSQPYPAFMQNLNLGILPKHIWNHLNIGEFGLSNVNISPVGTGPYKIVKINRDSVGIPKSYILGSFKSFTLGEPLIKRFVMKFARNQEELISFYEGGEADSIYGLDAREARILQIGGNRIKNFPLPRVFGILLNQNENPVLASNHVRRALQLATPKTRIIDEVLFGFGTIIDSPVPQAFFSDSDRGPTTISSVNYDLKEAENILIKNGWERNDDGIMIKENGGNKQMLSIVLSTSNVEQLHRATNIVADSWREIGVNVEVRAYGPSDLGPSVIRPRKFDALLFGLVIGRDMDFYAFWHSSQRIDPGLNIVSYANIDVDKTLENIRNADDPKIINEGLIKIESEIKKDIPAIFLYSPNFIYVVPNKLNGLSIDSIVSAEERFSEVYNWHIYTRNVWEFLIR